jgi:hypothetical protein
VAPCACRGSCLKEGSGKPSGSEGQAPPTMTLEQLHHKLNARAGRRLARKGKADSAYPTRGRSNDAKWHQEHQRSRPHESDAMRPLASTQQSLQKSGRGNRRANTRGFVSKPPTLAAFSMPPRLRWMWLLFWSLQRLVQPLVQLLRRPPPLRLVIATCLGTERSPMLSAPSLAALGLRHCCVKQQLPRLPDM